MSRDYESDLKVCEAATPGPWKKSGTAKNPHWYVSAPDCLVHGGAMERSDNVESTIRRWIADADFMVLAREALPWYISQLRAVEQERERLREALGTALGAMEHADWSNGVTDPTGTIDEGVVRFCELRDELLKALPPSKEGARG